MKPVFSQYWWFAGILTWVKIQNMLHLGPVQTEGSSMKTITIFLINFFKVHAKINPYGTSSIKTPLYGI